MPPKRGTKRKPVTESTAPNGHLHPTSPDRNAWPGWVEMESEPAFFNVMLKEMGVRGVKIQEVIGLDEEQMAWVPRPIHAFIFLFQYKDAATTQEETDCPQDIWFANQIPDFACASVALLNCINNIKGLQMDKEMRNFKNSTKDLDPIARGDAIDGFDFLRRIHNSFARETDILTADMIMRNKMNKMKKRHAAAQAQATKRAKKEAATSDKRSDSAVTTPTRPSGRTKKPPVKKTKIVKAEVPNSEASSLPSDSPDSDPEFTESRITKTDTSSPPAPARRSARQPKLRKDPNTLVSEAEELPPEEGFHYVAYIPLRDKVWKLDGMDSCPHLVGQFDADNGGTWLNVATPEIQTQMWMLEGGSIAYNLMAVVHDPIVAAREELAANVNELRAIDAKLDAVSKDWRSASTDPDEIVLGPTPAYDLGDADLAAAPLPADVEGELAKCEDAYINKLTALRKRRIATQPPLRAAVRDHLSAAIRDEQTADLRRHDFGGFVRGWLGALAEQQDLKEVVDGAPPR